MSSETLVTYTCDRCGRTEACGGGRTPEGWMRAELAPLADVTLPADVTTLSGEPAPMPRTALRLDWCGTCAAIAVPTHRSPFLDEVMADLENEGKPFGVKPHGISGEGLRKAARAAILHVLALEVFEASS